GQALDLGLVRVDGVGLAAGLHVAAEDLVAELAALVGGAGDGEEVSVEEAGDALIEGLVGHPAGPFRRGVRARPGGGFPAGAAGPRRGPAGWCGKAVAGTRTPDPSFTRRELYH